MSPGTGLAPDQAAPTELAGDLREQVQDLYRRYYEIVSIRDLHAWPGFFTPGAVYKVWPKDGLARGLPMPLKYLDGLGMIKDWATILMETTYAQPRHLSCQWQCLQISQSPADAGITATGTLDVTHALLDEPPRKVFTCRFRDDIVSGTDRNLLFSAREIVYGNRRIIGSLVYPL